MLFKTDLRNDFCNVWRQRYGKESGYIDKAQKQEIYRQMRPSATTYISFLSMRGIFNNFYVLTDSGIFGKRDSFKRVISVDEERDAMHGDSVVSNYILKEGAVKNDVTKSLRYLQETVLFPSYTPPVFQKQNPTSFSPAPSIDIDYYKNLVVQLDPPSPFVTADIDNAVECPERDNFDIPSSSSKSTPFLLDAAHHFLGACSILLYFVIVSS